MLKEKSLIEKILSNFDYQNKIFNDLNEFIFSLEQEFHEDLYLDLKKSLKLLTQNIKSLEAICYLSDKADKFDCYLEIHAGAGGTESQDWADMIRKMYLKWSDKNDRVCTLISESKGEEVGTASQEVANCGTIFILIS